MYRRRKIYSNTIYKRNDRKQIVKGHEFHNGQAGFLWAVSMKINVGIAEYGQDPLILGKWLYICDPCILGRVLLITGRYF